MKLLKLSALSVYTVWQFARFKVVASRSIAKSLRGRRLASSDNFTSCQSLQQIHPLQPDFQGNPAYTGSDRNICGFGDSDPYFACDARSVVNDPTSLEYTCSTIHHNFLTAFVLDRNFNVCALAGFELLPNFNDFSFTCRQSS